MPESTPSAPPRISIIVPALHESHRINSLIAHVRENGSHIPIEVIVADGSPEGDTLDAITDGEVVKVSSPPGRGQQMNAGSLRATGDIVLFLHADTRLPEGGLHSAARTMENPRYRAGAFRLGIDSPAFAFRVIEFWSMVRVGLSRVPFGDQAIFMRNTYFREIGGYRDIPIMEDVELMVRIRKRGDRIRLLPDRVRTSARRWEQEGIVRCMVRNWILRAFYAMKTPPEKLVKFYRSDRQDKEEGVLR